MRKLEETRVRYGPTRQFYQAIAGHRSTFTPKVTCCRSKDGDLVSNQPEVLSRWAQYFDELLNDQFNEQLEAPPADEIMLQPPSIEETRKAIRRLKNNKSPGTDGITAELIKNGGANLENEIHRLISEIWDSESMPCDWNLGIIYPIYKKGDKLDCSNYRGITVLNTAYKIFSLVLQERLDPYAEEIANLLDPAHSQLVRCDPLVLSNILHYCNSYHELILKIVSILDAFVPKEIAGDGGCHLSVSHDEESRTIAIQYGDITEEDLENVEEPLDSEYASKGDAFDDEECEECQALFNDIESLNSHHVTHRMKRTAKPAEFDSLLQGKFSPAGIRARKCEFCDIVMDCKVNVYSRHCLEVHNRSPYACPLCNTPFHLQSHMREHLKTEHSQEEVDLFIKQNLWREFAVHDGEQMAECRFCYLIIYSRVASRASHAERHRLEVRRSCARCGGKHFEVFCSHPKETFEAKYQRRHCAHCDRWISKKNFKEHLVTHTKERSFPCTMCKKVFKVRRTATRHIQSHVNASNRKRKCYDCPTVLEDETEIPEHYRQVHPSLEPYRCPICSTGFNQKAKLEDHSHTHSDDERRTASIKCPVHSYHVGNARVFECTLCRRVFTTKRATVAHWIVHTDRPCVCTRCSLSFRAESLLDTHMVDVHKVKKNVAIHS
ncbi:zinc finger protein 84-like [Anopheles ziemanni]|uniref:zinc finger protein 84-like n=1 Tax=Anopheles ziemanni TaxID=345580 RepID=UPI0026604E03|nr:zinc finger protein 84-like [Anopheles ziemanni]